jgi:hypothetical protein
MHGLRRIHPNGGGRARGRIFSRRDDGLVTVAPLLTRCAGHFADLRTTSRIRRRLLESSLKSDFRGRRRRNAQARSTVISSSQPAWNEEHMSDDDQPGDGKVSPKSRVQAPYFGFAGTGAEEFNSVPVYSGQQMSVNSALLGSLSLNEAMLNASAEMETSIANVRAPGLLAMSHAAEEKLAVMSERLAALEKALASIAAPTPGMGHNRPPEPIDELPLTPKKRRRLKASVAAVKAEVARPRRNPNKVLAAARALKPIAKGLKSFCKKQSALFVTGAVGAGAIQAGNLWGTDIHDGSLKAIHEVSLRLFDLIQAVEGWASLIGKLL